MKKRNISLDLLKITLAIFVVLLHSHFCDEYNETISYLTVNGIFRIAVPIFFLINGYFFSYTIENNKVIKWIIRVLILYSVWMIIYSPLWFTLNIKHNIISLLVGYHHLWYIKAMLISGILLFSINNKKTKNMLVLAFSLFLIGGILQYLGNYHIFKLNILDKFTNVTYIYRNFLFLGFPFFIIGYLIKVNDWQKKINSKQIVFLIPFSILILLLESYINYSYTREGVDILFSLIIICPLIFIYALNLNMNYNVNSKNISLISTAIYLIHPWVLKILTEIHQFGSTFLVLLTIIISFTISLIIIKINKKIKFLL